MVEAIRRSCSSKHTILDIHLCVDRPLRYIDAMAKSGHPDRIIFQIEALQDIQEAFHLCSEIERFGMKAGVSLNPSTSLDAILPLVEAGVIDLVDILAVEPGFGGQKFQSKVALEKIRALRKFIDDLKME